MSRSPRQWWIELTGDGRAWSIRHPVEQIRHLAHLLRQRCAADSADALAERVLANWDRQVFNERFRGYWDPFPTKQAPKYLDLGYFMRDSSLRCFTLGMFDDGRPKRVLDVGCGPGYFLSLCRELGHDVVGIDLDNEPLYNELVDFQGLRRIVHSVTPQSPLPVLDGTFDIVSAFGVTFNFVSGRGGGPWSASDWVLAIDGFLSAVAPGGKIVLHFNREPRTGRLYPPGLRRRLQQRKDLWPSFFGEHLIIDRLGGRSVHPGSE